jgi:hypothetical protein
LQLQSDGEDAFCISYIDLPGTGRLVNRVPYPPGSFDGEPIEIGEGQIQDVRGVLIAVSTANGVIRGQIKFEKGSLPPDALIDVSIVMLPPSQPTPYSGAAVDPDGRFVIRSLVPGQYMIRAAAYTNRPTGQKDGGMIVLARTSQTVTIGDEQDTAVTLTLNLGGKPEILK